MVYDEQLQNKHHYMFILQEADACRREIEKVYNSDKAEDYQRICSFRSAAFVELIKLNVPFVDMGIKVRIVIDNENYDMDKDTLRSFLGDEQFYALMSMKAQNTVTMQDVELGTHLPDGCKPIEDFRQVFNSSNNLPYQYTNKNLNGTNNMFQQRMELPLNNAQMGYYTQEPTIAHLNVHSALYPQTEPLYPQPIYENAYTPAINTNASMTPYIQKEVNENNNLSSQMESVVKDFNILLQKLDEKISTPIVTDATLLEEVETAHANENAARKAEQEAIEALEKAKAAEETAVFIAEQVKENLSHYKQENTRLKTDITAAIQEKNAAEEKVSKSEKELIMILTEKNKAVEEREQAEIQKKHAEESRIAAEQLTKKAELRASKAEESKSLLEKDKASLEASMQKLMEDNTKLKSTKERLTSEALQIENDKRKLEYEVTQLSSQNSVLANEKRVLLKEKEQALAELKKTEESIDKQIQQSTHDLRAIIDKANKELEEYKSSNSINQQIVDSYEEKLKESSYLAYYDSLTGLKNKNAFNKDFVDVDMQTSALVIFGIRRMKQINDSFGRKVGDATICSVADVLKQHFQNDEIYRIVGDEFAVVVKKYSKETKRTCGKIKNLLSSNNILVVFGLSVGTQAGSPAEMVQIAEKYFVENKSRGIENNAIDDSIHEDVAEVLQKTEIVEFVDEENNDSMNNENQNESLLTDTSTVEEFDNYEEMAVTENSSFSSSQIPIEDDISDTEEDFDYEEVDLSFPIYDED